MAPLGTTLRGEPMARAMVINPKDNVAVALEDLAPRDVVDVTLGNATTSVAVRQPIPFGHKMALKEICKGQDIIKYGELIGRATTDIAAGEHVHVHNVEGTRGRGDLAGAKS